MDMNNIFIDMTQSKDTLNKWFRSIPIDDWSPLESDVIAVTVKNAIIFPVSKFFDLEPTKSLDSFMMIPKRCYNSDEVRNHICHYVNYFEAIYDTEHEYLFQIYRIKSMIDYGIVYNDSVSVYTKDHFVHDILTYILSDSMYDKVWELVEDNYTLCLSYKNKTNEALQYSDRHGKYFMEISFFQNLVIPLIMHFCYKNKINGSKIDEMIFEMFNHLFDQYINQAAMQRRGLKPADMFSKLYETVNTTMLGDFKNNKPLWEKCEIRGMNPTINTNDAINTAIMQVMPKFKFNNNMIMYTITSIRNAIKFTIDIRYEYDFTSLSNSKRDGEDNTSQFDKYEAHLIKTDEGLLIQNDFRARKVMETIIAKFGPFEEDEINFYRKELIKNGRPLINKFQQNLINNMFFKYFGDTYSINSINARDYVILMISAKRILLRSGMKILPYIIAGNIQRISTRTTLCKKELVKLESSEYYKDILRKYNNDERKTKLILSNIATMLSSNFTVIDYYDKELNGINIIMDSDIIINEFLMFVLQI